MVSERTSGSHHGLHVKSMRIVGSDKMKRMDVVIYARWNK